MVIRRFHLTANMQEAAPNNWYTTNIAYLESEINWFEQVVATRMALHFGQESQFPSVEEVPVPELEPSTSPYYDFTVQYQLDPPDRLVLLLALMPHLRPQVLDAFLATHPDKVPVTEFGGHKGQVHKGFIPTMETLLFLLSGTDLRSRIFYQQHFSTNHLLLAERWLYTETIDSREPGASALLLPSTELVKWITTGDLGHPDFGASFPAQRIETKRNWDDLVLAPETLAEVNEILDWIRLEKLVMEDWGLGEKMMPGYRCLFYGPPGTGKTFCTTLLGKVSNREVYRIDLSMVVSKYIGETEKNLKNVFDKAQSRDWILFFDEADALFGKRTEISDSKDRFANQEVSYLLQRVENFDGVVILATNNRENLDQAFTRRFQSVTHFPMPSPAERLLLWQTALPTACELAEDVDLNSIAHKYEVSGGNIMNVVRNCALRAARRGDSTLYAEDFREGVRKEYRKVGRLMK